MDTAFAYVILIATVALALVRPRVFGVRIEAWIAAALGGIATVAVGLVPLSQVGSVVEFLSDPMMTLVGLMTVTLVADRAGVFRLIAWRVAVAAKGSGHRLFAYLFAAAAMTGALFTNDAAVLIFTPLVYRLVEDVAEPDWGVRQKLPYYFAVLYVANLVGPLLISNPIALVVAGWFDLGFTEYAQWMLLPAIASTGITFVGLWLFFRRSIPATFQTPSRPADYQKGYVIGSTAVFLLALVAFFSESITGLPTAFVALSAATVMLLLLVGFERVSPVNALRGVSWEVVAFVFGIFIVANGLRAAGITDLIGDVIRASMDGGEHLSNLATSYLAGGASALVNNHPVADAMAIAIIDLDLPEMSTRLKIFSALIGGELGPKMLPIGSLAALIWFQLLRHRGVDVSYWLYIKIGVPVTLAAIFVSVVVLGLQYELFFRGP